jgi:hypothetical protein
MEIKIAVLIPDRNDRPKFLANCLRMIENQTLKPNIIEVINEPPKNDFCDITYRYRTGYDKLRNQNIDVIALMENDDWYAPNYLETMVKKWVESGKPDLLGTSYTIYYHIGLFAYHYMHHMERSSAMSTLIKPDLYIKWCDDKEPYTDMHLWNYPGLSKVIFTPETNICLGIKHNVGLCGGLSHSPTKLYRYNVLDNDKSFLKSVLDAQSFEFYSNYFNK